MATNNAINFPSYGFNAVLASPLPNATGAGTLVTNCVDTVLYQTPDNSFNVGTGVYTCPKTGFYAVSGLVIMGDFAGGATQGSAFIVDSGTLLMFTSAQPTSIALAAILYFNLSGIFYSLAGSTIRMCAQAEYGTDTVYIALDTIFSVRYLGS